MAEFVELPQVSGGTVWLNPEHVVAVNAAHSGGAWVMTEMGQRFQVDLGQVTTVKRLAGWDSDGQRLPLGVWYGPERDEVLELSPAAVGRVRENLNRG